MGIDQDIERIALQEERIRFEHFDAETAWTLGTKLKAAAEERNQAVAIDIQLRAQSLFFYAMRGTTSSNIDWIRRKRNLVTRFHRSSYAIGLTIQRDHSTLQGKLDVDSKDFAAHGGCFPIFLTGPDCIGTITVSGLPQRQDHVLVVAVLADYLGIPYEELALA